VLVFWVMRRNPKEGDGVLVVVGSWLLVVDCCVFDESGWIMDNGEVGGVRGEG
jgi:hypothetical protein